MVKDKINARARGPRTALTRQTVGGRANGGGLRIGEMDRDAVIAHGITNFIKDSMMERGDKFKLAICNKTGTIAIYNESQNLFVSLFADGPIKFSRNKDYDMNIVPVTKYGRDFSIIEVPYSFKLLYHELQAMNIQMRIITDDNVDQMTSLKSSNNIELLTGLKNFKDVIGYTMDKLRNQNKNKNIDLPDANIVAPEQQEREDDVFPEMAPSAFMKSEAVDTFIPKQREAPMIFGSEMPDLILQNGKEVYINRQDNYSTGNSERAKIIDVEKTGEINDWDVTVILNSTGEMLDVKPDTVFLYVYDENTEPALENEETKQRDLTLIKQFLDNKPPSPNYSLNTPTESEKAINLDIQELPENPQGFRSYNVQQKTTKEPEISEDPFDKDVTYKPLSFKKDMDDNSDEERGGKGKVERKIIDNENKSGLDALLVKNDKNENNDENDGENDGVKKKVSVKTD